MTTSRRMTVRRGARQRRGRGHRRNRRTRCCCDVPGGRRRARPPPVPAPATPTSPRPLPPPPRPWPTRPPPAGQARHWGVAVHGGAITAWPYVTATGDAAPSGFSVHRLADGTRQTQRARSPTTGAPQSATMSPDGEWLAFVLGDAVGLTHGDELYAVNLTKEHTTRLLARASTAPAATTPIWWPDSASLRVTPRPLGRVVSPPAPLPRRRGAITSPFGRWPRVVAGRLETADGQLIRQLPPVPSAPVGSSIQAVSADGRYVAVPHPRRRPSTRGVRGHGYRERAGGRAGDLVGPGTTGGEQLSNVFFLANGGMIVCTNVRNTPNVTWRLVRAVGSVAALTAAPTFVSTGQFTYLG